jgi:ADP-ribosylation factor GTPase-activating protein 2/3
VIVEDSPEDAGSGTNTPSGEPAGDDFFSSWDKPSIKRPSNPPSRTGTPSNVNRTASPFLNANANGNGIARSKSPLAPLEGESTAAPAAAKSISTSAIRKTAVASKPKANILGAKKTKLGAKKVDASALDFDEAEKKAREEAERKERLGYDPDEETPSESQIKASQPDTAASTIHAPTPLSPGRGAPGGFGSTAGKPRERSDSEMERLGMGVRRLGFGQVGGGAPKGSAPKAMGFGSTSKAPVVGEFNVLTSKSLIC